jgi:hypothetical protein
VPLAVKASRETMANQLRGRGVDGSVRVPPNSIIAPANNPEFTAGGNDGHNASLLKNRWQPNWS